MAFDSSALLLIVFAPPLFLAVLLTAVYALGQRVLRGAFPSVRHMVLAFIVSSAVSGVVMSLWLFRVRPPQRHESELPAAATRPMPASPAAPAP